MDKFKKLLFICIQFVSRFLISTIYDMGPKGLNQVWIIHTKLWQIS